MMRKMDFRESGGENRLGRGPEAGGSVHGGPVNGNQLREGIAVADNAAQTE